MDISIITVNYRGWEALDACLGSLVDIHSPIITYEVIVVDNSSNDGQLESFRKKYSQFHFLENTGNHGFANGCNFGAENALGKYLFFLNPDTTLTTRALEGLYSTAKTYPEIGILSCLQINENGKYYNLKNLFPSFWRFFGIQRAIYRKLRSRALEEKFRIKKGLFFPDWVTGAVIFISREWFDKIGGWNEDYWLYLEDVDICKRLSEKGGKVAVDTGETIFHKHGGSSRINLKTKALTKTEVIISKHVYIDAHFSGFKKGILHITLIVSIVLEKLLLSIVSLVLFFKPKLKVNFLILKRITRYYLNALNKKTWISPRAANYSPKSVASIS